MRRTVALPALAAAAALTACGAPPQAADPGPDESLACEQVPQGVLDALTAGAEEGTGGFTVTRGAAHKSPNYENVWFVAAEFTADGIDPTTGVWATNNLTEGEARTILAVDSFAQGFTVYPDGDTTAFDIPAAGQDVENARTCLDQMS